jgi:cobalamin biosynthetic protein CobC
MIEHGGKLRAAARQWGIPLEQWLDLSTGIAPWPYPVPPIPLDCWQRLPEDEDDLLPVARTYYGSERLIALPGSQAAILTLPRLRSPGTVAILDPAYGEYAPAWRAAGHAVSGFAAEALGRMAEQANVVMVANPNNPDGTRFAAADLLAAAAALQKRQGWLIVDEAFADAAPEQSLAAVAGGPDAPNLIVLRSLGKFFGLAGARVGFAIAHPDLLQALQEAIGPWAISHPARFVACQALANREWQAQQQTRLRGASERLAVLLQASGLVGEGARLSGTALFQTLFTPHAEALFLNLARQGILIRHFPQWQAVRFGLPGVEMEWERLQRALTASPS